MESKFQKAKKQKLKEDRIKEETKECSFHPKVMNIDGPKKYANPKFANESKGVRKALELNSIAKKKLKDRDPNEIEFEKNEGYCTFAPNIKSTKNNLKSIAKPKQYFAKNVDKTVERMKKSRQEREYLNWWKDGRGYNFPKYDKNAKKKNSKSSNTSKMVTNSHHSSQKSGENQEYYG